MKRMLALTALLCMILCCRPGRAEVPSQGFAIRYGSRDEPRIAITVDDAYQLEYVRKILDLFREYHVKGTFFPIGVQLEPNINLNRASPEEAVFADPEECRKLWQDVIDSGCEIGSHYWEHVSVGWRSHWTILSQLGRFQEELDRVLGYHYQVNSFRPPFGNIEDKSGSMKEAMNAIRAFGYEHIVKWDVSQTNPDTAVKQVKNGSILLYHARHKDYVCLQKLIPALLEKGYELVTVSELLDFGENEISEELYVYDKSNYK